MTQERRIDSQGYIPKKSLGKNAFEREILFAFRWAMRSGRECVEFTEDVVVGARDYLSSSGVEVDNLDKVQLVSQATKRFLEEKELDGVDVGPDEYGNKPISRVNLSRT